MQLYDDFMQRFQVMHTTFTFLIISNTNFSFQRNWCYWSLSTENYAYLCLYCLHLL